MIRMRIVDIYREKFSGNRQENEERELPHLERERERSEMIEIGKPKPFAKELAHGQ